MPCIRKVLIQSPEAAYKTFGILGNRLREITALRGNRTDNGNGTFCTIQIAHHACSLVERRQTGCQISRKALLCRHLFQTAGKLTQRLSPTGSRVCHDRYMIAHIPVILCQCYTCIQTCLTSCNRHVGGICDQCSSVHQGISALWVDQF